MSGLEHSPPRDTAQSPVRSTPLPTPGAVRLGKAAPSGSDLQREWIAGLLSPFAGRARSYLERLIEGLPPALAAVRSGISLATIDLWASEDQGFAESIACARLIGNAEGLEAELLTRAFAGEWDRHSMRALELATKAYLPQYREQSSVAGSLTVTFQQSMAAAVGGWRQRVIEGVATPVLPEG